MPVRIRPFPYLQVGRHKINMPPSLHDSPERRAILNGRRGFTPFWGFYAQKMNNRENFFIKCFEPTVNENENIKKLKPLLIISLFIILTIVFLDFFVFETTIYIYLSLIILPIFLIVLKRFYYIFTIYTLIFIIFIIPKIINDLGAYFQVELMTTTRKFILCLKIFCFILLLVVYYIFFQYYKELKFLYIEQKQSILKRLIEESNED